MLVPNSPLFPESLLTLSPAVTTTTGAMDDTLIPNLPEKPLAHSGSIQIFVIPTEKNLFVQGFEPHEFESQSPTLLRGVLVVRIVKPCKIKSISLSLKGFQKTEWPEGIPPKKTVYSEINDTVSHTWPFYQAGQTTVNNGADFFRELSDSKTSHGNDLDLVSTVSLSPTTSTTETNASSSFFARSLSPAFLRRAVSPTIVDNHTVADNEGQFNVGDYIYNFEQPLRPSIPETCSVAFGSVYYYLEVNVIRIGAFKSNITSRLPVEIIRTPSIFSMEENEPIVITRDWEDQLRYDIVVGGKSVVLDSYLPLAFRFVPLWGKVQLHRIRVYLTENNEYYCQNKKVHRLEPPRKYLLLEHKANKGRSLLSRNPMGEPNTTDEDDEILNRELEFQLFVPSKIPNRAGAMIHPDTSFDNIQVHHWIKICLRISKTDPENAEKRKHYEISIDSPIHVLSPLAVHSNTLLPVYDDQVPALPEYPKSPPMSPGVVAVDYSTGPNSSLDSRAGGIRNLFQHSDPGNSIDRIIESSSPEPNFRHISSNNNNDEPFEREADMHLEANLYKPDLESIDPQINSPQAMPYSPNSTPLQRPIHLLRKPSMNPPPFDADTPPPAMDCLPPAYEEHDLSISPLRNQETSLSPLRIDDPEHHSRRAPTAVEAVLARKLHAPIPLKSRTNTPSPLDESEDTTKQDKLPLSHMELASYLLPTIQLNGQSKDKETPIPEKKETEEEQKHSLQKKPTHEHDKNVDKDEESTEKHQEGENLDKESDITDFPSPLFVPQSPLTGSRAGYSRRSSISSISSEVDHPIDQTMPLLCLSTSSVAPSNRLNSLASNINSSVNSLLFDTERRLTSTKIIDLGDSNEYHINLHQMRNPRINKPEPEETHENTLTGESNIDEESNTELNETSENNSLSSSREYNEQIKLRQKSFGVIQNFDDYDNSLNPTPRNTSELNSDTIPGLNTGYIM